MTHGSIDRPCMKISGKPLLVVFARAECAALGQKHALHDTSKSNTSFCPSRRELVSACTSAGSNRSVLFRAFVQALGGLGPRRNGRKRCRKHGLKRSDTKDTPTRSLINQVDFYKPFLRHKNWLLAQPFQHPIFYGRLLIN